MAEPYWVDPAAIRFKITPHNDLSGTQGGEWDVERRQPFADTAKARSMVQRYRDGRRWIDTELFTDTYARRLTRDGHIGAHSTLAALAEDYHRRFDAMFDDMQARGFTQIPCGDGFTAGLQNFRDGMCAMAAQAPDAAKTKFATTFGVTPQEACDMATAVLNSQNGS